MASSISLYVITQVLLNICFANLVSAIFIKSISIVHNGFVRIMFVCLFMCLFVNIYVFVCKYLFICLTNLVSAIFIQSISILQNGFARMIFLLPFHLISSNSYIPYLILETVEIAKTAGFNNHLSFPEYIWHFFSSKCNLYRILIESCSKRKTYPYFYTWSSTHILLSWPSLLCRYAVATRGTESQIAFCMIYSFGHR